MPTFDEIKSCLITVLLENGNYSDAIEELNEAKSILSIENVINGIMDNALNRKLLLCFNKYKPDEG